MTREECENKLLEIMGQALAVLHEYDPQADRLSMYAHGGTVNVQALADGVDTATADFGDVAHTYAAYATKYADGVVWHSDKWQALHEGARECA